MITTLYVHANPLRAGMVRDASHYFWSTHRLYALGKREAWMSQVRLPLWYRKLGRNPAQRQSKYRKLFAAYLKAQGLTKQYFLHKHCFGPIDKMLSVEKAIRQWRKENRPPP